MNKPRLSFRQISNMSFGFLGIQFGWGLQLANMSAIYSYLGAKESDIPFLWLAGPVTGLIVQPIIGAMSDRTWNWLGRRRPYFLVGAILASIALFFMPDSRTLFAAATLLWILDASINVSMEPFRAFVADKLNPDQRTVGFVMQSFFIGIGASLANALPYIFRFLGVTGRTPSGIPFTVQYSFKIGAVVFLLGGAYIGVATAVFHASALPGEMLLVVGMVIMGWNIARYGALLSGEFVAADFRADCILHPCVAARRRKFPVSAARDCNGRTPPICGFPTPDTE